MINCPYNIIDYLSEVIVLTKGNIEIEKIEKMDVFEITDVYNPNKRGVLMKDFINVT